MKAEESCARHQCAVSVDRQQKTRRKDQVLSEKHHLKQTTEPGTLQQKHMPQILLSAAAAATTTTTTSTATTTTTTTTFSFCSTDVVFRVLQLRPSLLSSKRQPLGILDRVDDQQQYQIKGKAEGREMRGQEIEGEGR